MYRYACVAYLQITTKSLPTELMTFYLNGAKYFQFNGSNNPKIASAWHLFKQILWENFVSTFTSAKIHPSSRSFFSSCLYCFFFCCWPYFSSFFLVNYEKSVPTGFWNARCYFVPLTSNAFSLFICTARYKHIQKHTPTKGTKKRSRNFVCCAY